MLDSTNKNEDRSKLRTPQAQRQQTSSISDTHDLSSIDNIRESLLREIKEIRKDCDSTVTPRSAKISRRSARIRGLNRRSLQSQSTSALADRKPLQYEPFERSGSESTKDISTHSVRSALDSSSSARKNAMKKSTGKKVLNVASLPFRSVKRRFGSQTSSNGNEKFFPMDNKENFVDEDDTKTVSNVASMGTSEKARTSSFSLTRTSSSRAVSEFVTRTVTPVANLLSGRSNHDQNYSKSSPVTNTSPIDDSRPPSTRNTHVISENLTNESNKKFESFYGSELTAGVLCQIESMLRIICALYLAYYMGIRFPEYQIIVNKIGEYSVVAWTTCMAIQTVTLIRQHFCSPIKHQQNDVSNSQDQQLKLYEMSSDDGDTDDFVGEVQSTLQSLVRTSRDEPVTQNGDNYCFLEQKENVNIPTSPASDSNELPHSPSNTHENATDVAHFMIDDQNLHDNAVRKIDFLVSDTNPTNLSNKRQQSQTIVHPSLEQFFIIDTSNNSRVFANSSVPYYIDTDYFEGHLLILIRTPDVDDLENIANEQASDISRNENAAAANYFRDKLRRFEFQFQIKLKRVPTGRVYFSCELKDAFKLGMIQRAFVGAAMAFVKSTNKSFHYSLSGTQADETDKMRFEAPHMAFPVEEGMNRLVATPPGLTPPTLGHEIEEDPESIKKRKKGIPVVYNTTDTYTFSLWSQYVDFLEWQCLNLPGIRPFSITSVIGTQPILLTVYEISDNDSVTGKLQEKHFKSEITNILTLEMSNASHCPIGSAAKQWLSYQQNLKTNGEALDNKPTLLDQDAGESDNKVKPRSNADYYDVDTSLVLDDTPDETDPNDLHPLKYSVNLDDGMADDETEQAAEELGEGFYVRSGDTIAIRELNEVINISASTSMSDLPSLEQCFVDSSIPGRNNDIPTELASTSLLFPTTYSYITNSGGFAVLHENTPQAIVIEKTGKLARRGKNSSKLIKSGDTVTFKIVSRGRKNDDGEPVKFLSIHRGWWLKWVSSAPTKNGYFTVHTKESEVTEQPDGLSETQSSYLTLGGSFYLKHKRWSKYRVGVAAEGSTTFGGRMLGLHLPSNLAEVGNSDDFPANLEDCDLDLDNPNNTDEKRGDVKSSWMRPLVLQASEFPSVNITLTPSLSLSVSEKVETKDLLLIGNTKPRMLFAQGHYHMDVPAWLEILNRTERVRQHTYVVRVLPPTNTAELDATDEVDSPGKKDEKKYTHEAFVRLRTGRNLALVMRTGMKWRNSLTNSRRFRPSLMINNQKTNLTQPSPIHRQQSLIEGSWNLSTRVRSSSSPSSADANDVTSVHSFDDIDNIGNLDDKDHGSNFLGMLENVKREDEESESDADSSSTASSDQVDNLSDNPNRRGKGRKLLGKVAKAVKTTAASTGRTVVRTTTNTGKSVVLGTVNVGKSILPIRPKNPPNIEPKSVSKRHAAKQRGKDLDLDVRSRSMKRIELLEARNSQLGSPMFLAGELSAPEQSCRAVSNMVSRMSSEPESSSLEKGFSSLLASLVESTSELDNGFLKGGSLQLGVSPKAESAGKRSLAHDCVVARCLWESHWREEWCGIYDNVMHFYAPLTDKPCLELSILDIKNVRVLDSPELHALPGYPLLVLETAWLCHCCAFANEMTRDLFLRKVESAMKSCSERETESSSETELRQAHFWQGFQNSLDVSLAIGRGKWAAVQSGSKIKSRVILNNRRMKFDLPSADLCANNFVEELLGSALRFSLSSLKQNPEALISFLDGTSRLRNLSLEAIDRSSKEAFCLFVNIYHCLLQHALLFSVNGPLHKRSRIHFMRTSCYEIGGDVFSLSELYSCVIRGKMSRASVSKPPFVEVAKRSSAHQCYALDFVTQQTIFLLNTADCTFPRSVPVFNPLDLEEQIKTQVSEFLNNNIFVEVSKKLILLPKLFEIYKSDFTQEDKGFAVYCLNFALPYLSDGLASTLRILMQDDVVIKFQPTTEQFHLSLLPLTY